MPGIPSRARRPCRASACRSGRSSGGVRSHSTIWNARAGERQQRLGQLEEQRAQPGIAMAGGSRRIVGSADGDARRARELAQVVRRAGDAGARERRHASGSSAHRRCRRPAASRRGRRTRARRAAAARHRRATERNRREYAWMQCYTSIARASRFCAANHCGDDKQARHPPPTMIGVGRRALDDDAGACHADGLPENSARREQRERCAAPLGRHLRRVGLQRVVEHVEAQSGEERADQRDRPCRAEAQRQERDAQRTAARRGEPRFAEPARPTSARTRRT